MPRTSRRPWVEKRAPRVGQVWSILLSPFSHQRTDFTIDRIEGGFVYGRKTISGREVRMRVAALLNGRRGSSMVRDADGTEPFKPPPPKGQPCKADTISASDLVHETLPKGLHMRAQDQRVAALRAHGRSPQQIADLLGIRPQTVRNIIAKLEDHDRLARLRAS